MKRIEERKRLAKATAAGMMFLFLAMAVVVVTFLIRGEPGFVIEAFLAGMLVGGLVIALAVNLS